MTDRVGRGRGSENENVIDLPDQTNRRRCRLSRRMRLLSAGQFDAVYQARASRPSGPFTVYTRPNGLPHPRLGLSVPRRVGTAVVRNRVKRRIREAFRLAQHDLPTGYDVVVNVRPHGPLGTEEYRCRLLAAVRDLDDRWAKRRK